MASAVASKGIPMAALFKELFASSSASGKTSTRRPSIIPKLFSEDSSEVSSDEDSSDDEDAAATRRSERNLSIPELFSGDVLDLFDEAMKLRLLLALMEDDGGAASRTGSGSSPRGWWVSKEDGDAVQLKVAMPGLGKEHVKMKAEKDILVIKGERDADKGSARYSYRIGFSSQAFKMEQIKAEMENGLLILTVPKIKDEERKDVFEIKIA